MARVRLFSRTVMLALLAVSAFRFEAFAMDDAPLPEGLADKVQGEWHFETPAYRGGFCSMSGTLSVFRPRSTSDSKLNCALNAVEVCAGKQSVVEQACTFRMEGNVGWVESEILTLLQIKDGSSGYAPDNFRLEHITPTRMSGQLVSAVEAPVEFTRADGGIS